MDIRTAQSRTPDAIVAVNDLYAQLNGCGERPTALIYFASSRYDPDVLSAAMERTFAPATVFGCTTAGELRLGTMTTGSVVAMAFERTAVPEVCLQLVDDLADGDGVRRAFHAFEQHVGASMLDLDPSRYVGIILVDGLSGAEERLMNCIGDLTDVPFIGGSAGDDLRFAATKVFAAGAAHAGAAVLALLQIGRGFDIIKTQSFRPLQQTLVPTRVCEASREVLAFDGKPAAVAYAEALSVPVDELADSFMSHPLGLMAGDEPYVRSPQQVVGERVRFYCAVQEGMPLTVLQATDIVEDTRAAISAKLAAMGGASAIVNFNCILRTLELQQTGRCEAYGELFAAVPTIGFSTYGEEYIGHINQTATMLVFK